MISSEYILELCNVFYSGQIEPGSCFQRMFGTIKTGVILKDVSTTVHSGEVLAVLGSKGSGKKALLDVISRRAQGPIRGQILLNGTPMSLCLFQQRCGYVTHKCDLIPGLSVEQTLYFTPTKVTSLKRTKVKQVMADLALSQVANKSVEYLTQSEYRRLMIGIQLIRDPAVLLLDEPTWDLDPLNTYLIVSILSNAAKKYRTAVILTMEKPRSDVFPFLERVLYLCLGDVVYTGGTRQMLEYFNAIGFPCPPLENPLMYYLCLSTVDRRSRERFVESNHQIAALVEKFKIEGGPYKKSSTLGNINHILEHGVDGKEVPLLVKRKSCISTCWNVYMRLLATIFSLRKEGRRQIFLRLFFLPLYFFLLYLFYRDMKDYQHTFITRNGLILNCLCGVYFFGILNTILIFPKYRTRYFQEYQEGLYGGTIFLSTYNFVSITFSFISALGASAIIYPLIGSFDEPMEYFYISLTLWACYVFTEQQTITILMIVKDHITAAIFSIYVTGICITLSSGILRSIKGLQDWLYYLTFATQCRYSSAFLSKKFFALLTQALPFDDKQNCTNMIIETTLSGANSHPYCRYANGQSFLADRYSREHTENIFNGILDEDLNLGITFAFTLGMLVFNLFLYLIPLPAFVKAKFRE